MMNKLKQWIFLGNCSNCFTGEYKLVQCSVWKLNKHNDYNPKCITYVVLTIDDLHLCSPQKVFLISVKA